LAITYAIVVVVFAGWFLMDYFLDVPRAWSNVPTPYGAHSFPLWEFLYFSLTTIVPFAQGYSPIRPESAWARGLVSAEAVFGTALFVVVFAALLAYLDPRFKEVARLRTRRGPR
jgi:hypothetical protein